MMIAGGLEKNLFNAYIFDLFKNTEETARVMLMTDPKKLALYLSDGYEKWLRSKLQTSSDKYLVMAILFVKLMEMFRLFRLSIRDGDSVMIEWLYSRFLPIYLATGKNQYVEIVLYVMESFYDKIPQKILHLVRVNKKVQLYAGDEKQGDPMAFWSHDAIIELLHKYVHQHKKENKIESWIQNSPHLMFMNKAKRMVQCDFGREQAAGKESKFLYQADDQGEGRENNRNKNRTFVPNRTLENKIISEFILLLKIGEYKDGRNYRSKDVWDIITEDDEK